MRRALLVAAVAAAVPGAVPAMAAARRTPELLQDEPPTATHFHDRVLTASTRTATASAADYHAYAASDGTPVRVAVSPSYSDQTALAESYVKFLGGLPHGPELADLRVYIGTPKEVVADCGGDSTVLACYDGANQTMYVPGEQSSAAASDGVTTSYVVAHEYGHHIAAHRSNAPFPALAFGPKYWASRELVCDRTLAGRLAPGNEGSGYAFNPGESWAETYAQLTYPGVAWSYTSLLKPTPAALAAARRDVLHPWTGPRHVTYRGRLSARHARQTFRFRLHLDGRASFVLRGPGRATDGLRVTANGKVVGHTKRAALRYGAACRTRQTETVAVTVLRHSGHRAFRLKVTYAG